MCCVCSHALPGPCACTHKEVMGRADQAFAGNGPARLLSCRKLRRRQAQAWQQRRHVASSGLTMHCSPARTCGMQDSRCCAVTHSVDRPAMLRQLSGRAEDSLLPLSDLRQHGRKARQRAGAGMHRASAAPSCHYSATHRERSPVRRPYTSGSSPLSALPCRELRAAGGAAGSVVRHLFCTRDAEATTGHTAHYCVHCSVALSHCRQRRQV